MPRANSPVTGVVRERGSRRDLSMERLRRVQARGPKRSIGTFERDDRLGRRSGALGDSQTPSRWRSVSVSPGAPPGPSWPASEIAEAACR